MKQFIKNIWDAYEEITPSAELIRKVLNLDNYEFFNDHMAYRSIQSDGVGIKELAKPFQEHGWKIKDSYNFKEKKLKAIHLEHTKKPHLPKVFISEIILSYFTDELQSVMQSCSAEVKKSGNLLSHGRSWDINKKTYDALLQESEYAAWLYLHGYRVNHFTIRVNDLENHNMNTLIDLLNEKEIPLNTSGGIIKGTKKQGLVQSSTLADIIPVQFSDELKPIYIPSCYVEFAERFTVKGKYFDGFITQSADKIFDSTDAKKNNTD